MIQIDIEMPKCCDVCMFSQWSNLSQTASCKLKDYEPCFDDFSKEYKSKRASFCPLHEVTDTDTISRQDAIEHLKKRLYESALNNDGIASYTFEEIADNRIQIWMDELPPLPSRPKGHWIKHHESRAGIVYSCDRCGRTLQALSWETRKDVYKMYPFCHCGADMRS